MSEILKTLLASTSGTVLLFTIVFLVIGVAVFVIIKLLSKDGEIKKFGVKWKSNKIQQNIFNINQKLALLESAFYDIYDKFLVDSEAIKIQVNSELKNTQKIALTRAIEYLCLEYARLHENNADIEESSLSQMGLILELYLRRDFGNVLLTRLDMIRENNSLYAKTEFEINDEVQKIVDDCVQSMKHRIKEYVLISDTRILHKLFDTSASKLRDNINETIKKFVLLSKKQQDDLIKLAKKRESSIDEKIRMIIGEDIDNKEESLEEEKTT